ncbi:MAG: ABC transporter permease subunit [Bacillota bacterium]|nr:ABC transporter permease subunit [Bacillota bacterium]
MIKSYKARRIISNTLIYIFLSVLCIIWVLPIADLIMTSFRATGGVAPVYLIPQDWTLNNYIELFTNNDTTFNYLHCFTNTLFVACCSCVLSTFSVLMVSYTFSRLRFKTRKFFINIGMILGMFPGFMTMIAIYYLLKAMNLDGRLVSLIICYSATAGLGYLISKGFFDTIPRALDEAATIDGATKNQIFWKIILPMSKPIVIYTILTSFIGPWCDFIFIGFIIGPNHPENFTIAYMLLQMVNSENINTQYLYFCAGSVLIAVPITLLFLKLQKFYVEGVTGGAVKG